MPNLRMIINSQLAVSVTQHLDIDLVQLDWYHLENNVGTNIYTHAIEQSNIKTALISNIDTHGHWYFWHIEAVMALVKENMKTVFDKIMTARLKLLALDEGISCHSEGIAWRFVQNPNGGMDEWFVSNGTDYLNGHHHTMLDVLDGLWRINQNIDAWKEIMMTKDLDDDDTQELPVVVLDENDERHQFDVFAVPRLARLCDVPALVLVGRTRLGYSLIVGVDGSDKWAMIVEHIDGTVGGMSIFKTMREVIDKMYELRRILVDGWQMRQETKTGRFDTILTEEWNKGVGNES